MQKKSSKNEKKLLTRSESDGKILTVRDKRTGRRPWAERSAQNIENSIDRKKIVKKKGIHDVCMRQIIVLDNFLKKTVIRYQIG